jgi:predicted RNase H-like nuclease (RuvC/YqgF family)
MVSCKLNDSVTLESLGKRISELEHQLREQTHINSELRDEISNLESLSGTGDIDFQGSSKGRKILARLLVVGAIILMICSYLWFKANGAT